MTRPSRPCRESRSPKTWWERRTVKPLIIKIINQKLQGRSWKFWSGIRDHCQANRIQVSVQEVQQEFEELHPTRIPESWRHHRSGHIRKRPHNYFKHVNTHSNINWLLERPDHGNHPKWLDQTIYFKNISTTAKHNQYLQSNLGKVLPSTPEWIVGRPIMF